MLRDTFFLTLFATLLAVAALYISDFFFFIFWRIWWLDTVVHFGGGFWAGGILLWGYAYIYEILYTKHSRIQLLFLSILSAFAIGTLWEIYEVILYPILSSTPDYLSDTVIDLIADVLGACMAGLYFFYTRARTTSLHEQESR